MDYTIDYEYQVSFVVEKSLISIITPLLNERRHINSFLENISKIEGDFELILVDGGSIDGTMDEVKTNRSKFNRRLSILESEPGRSNQMNKGAEYANGDILLFLHVDCLLQKGCLETIENTIKSGTIIGGGFKQAFTNSNSFLQFVSVLGNIRTRVMKIFFGDYGLFIRKDVFAKVGGYDNIQFLEDVELSKKVKKYGKLIQIDSVIRTSPRRYESKGRLRLSILFTLAYLFNLVKLRPKFLIKYIVEK